MPQLYCTHCGKLIKATANYCQFCGTPQHGIEAMAHSAMERSGQIAQANQAKQTPFSEKMPGETTSAATNTPDSTQQNPSNTSRRETRTIEKRRLCQRALWSFYLSYIGKTGLLLFLFFIGLVVEPLWFSVVIAVYLTLLYITAVVVHQNYYFEVNSSAFRKEYGVLHKTDVTIPFNRIQNVNITRSLSDRILGLARVDIESAGSSSVTAKNTAGGSMTKSEGHLPGVTMYQAREIHELLVNRFTELQKQPESSSP